MATSRPETVGRSLICSRRRSDTASCSLITSPPREALTFQRTDLSHPLRPPPTGRGGFSIYGGSKCWRTPLAVSAQRRECRNPACTDWAVCRDLALTVNDSQPNPTRPTSLPPAASAPALWPLLLSTFRVRRRELLLDAQPSFPPLYGKRWARYQRFSILYRALRRFPPRSRVL